MEGQTRCDARDPWLGSFAFFKVNSRLEDWGGSTGVKVLALTTSVSQDDFVAPADCAKIIPLFLSFMNFLKEPLGEEALSEAFSPSEVWNIFSRAPGANS